jgi:hypothetical protein
MRTFLLLLPLGLLLGGCATTDGALSIMAPVCQALIGPIHYTSHNAKSPRYAAAALAPDLAARNSVGERLHCPGY